MSNPMIGPAWYWWAGTIALVLWAWAAFGLIAGPFLGRWLRRTADGQTTKPPAPGTQLPIPGHHTPIAKRIHIHACGCIWAADRGRRWERTNDCDAIDENLRRLTQP